MARSNVVAVHSLSMRVAQGILGFRAIAEANEAHFRVSDLQWTLEMRKMGLCRIPHVV
jgi:hypothetical protein